jgi:hypothetical protein
MGCLGLREPGFGSVSLANRSLRAREPRLEPKPYKNSLLELAVEMGREQRDDFMIVQ